MQFKNIIGQRPLINKLTEIVDSGRISHAQLFLGAEGSQKLALAIAYGQYLNCKDRQHFPADHSSGLRADACGKCPSCVKYESLAHPDLYFLFPNNKREKQTKESKASDYMEEWRKLVKETNAEFTLQDWYQAMGIGNKQGLINVRDAQDLLQNLSFKNFEASYKVVIFWMVEKLYHAVAPKLLKILEEPPEGTLFILIAEDQDQLLKTILSRTQLVKVPRINDADIEEFLIQSEALSADKAHHLAIAAHGNLIQLKNLMQTSDIQKFNQENFIQWMRLCVAWKFYEITIFSSEIAALGRERTKDFLNYTLDRIRSAFLITFQQNETARLSADELNFMKNFAPFVNQNTVPLFMKVLEDAIYHVERNINVNMLMIDVSIKMTQILKSVRK